MSDSHIVGMTAADIETARHSLSDLVRRWFTSTVIFNNGPDTVGDYLALDQIAGPSIGCFSLSRNSDDTYSVEYVPIDGAPVEFPRVGTARAAADQISQVGADRVSAWGLQPA